MTRISQTWASPTVEARIGAHVHKWEEARVAGKVLPVGLYPFVTISRDYGCDAVPLAMRLTEILNERCHPTVPWLAYDRALLDEVSRQLHLHRGLLDALDGRRRDQMSELFDSVLNRRVDETLVVRKLAEIIRSLAMHGNAVLVGRGSHLVTQDLKTGLHVRLEAARLWRVHKVASDRGLSRQEADRLVAEAEKERAQYLRTFFVLDPEHPFHHDLVIDSSRFNLDQLVEIVFTAMSARFGERLVGG